MSEVEEINAVEEIDRDKGEEISAVEKRGS